ncbi:MAG: ATP-binding protein [Deltaproteobacteria bacterium]
MTSLWAKRFNDKTMGFKIISAFVVVALIPMLLIAFASYKVIDARLIKEADEKINTGIKTAWSEYLVRGEQMRYGMLQAASMGEVKEALKRNDAKTLKGMLTNWRERRPYVDLWIVVDSRGKVISRLNSDMRDDTIDINGLIEKAIRSEKSQVSAEILPAEMLVMEGEEFHRQVTIPVAFGSSEDEYKRDGKLVESDAMALVVVTPVAGEDQKSLGVIITADILNKDTHVPDAVSNKLPWLFTSISMDGLRITTNIRDSNGQTAGWTLLPAPVMSKTKLGRSILGESTILGQEFISIFDPIRDNKGKIIGLLDVGMPKTQLWAIQKENLTVIAAITFLGLAVSLVVAIIEIRSIISPLKLLREKADAFAGGEMDIRIDVDGDPNSKDELKILARAFNAMMNDVKGRSLEKEQHLKEVDEKNRQLIMFNESLKTVNEELEVSYEEVQSRTEELNAANEELKVLNEDLESKNRELREANRKIREEEVEQKALLQKLAHSEKLSSLGEIVSGVAHELNNPLTAIMGFSDLLLDKDLPEMAKKQLKMINDASQRSKRIIDNLLTFARAYKPEKKYNNLNSVITGTIDLKDYQLKVNSIDVELNLDPSLPKTMLDEHQLQQVFLNIINNAQHAVAEKGIGGRISINTTFDDKIIRATVSDTGKGIPEDRLKKIFDPFFTTKEVGAGTGLGLSISYGIIREHGGNIYATSRPGQGATFIIELPIIKAPEDSSPAATSKKSRLSKKGNRALVLDDEELILSLINEVLVDSGFHVDTAVSGDVALRLLSNQTYDLIISDFKMPGMNGKEFYHKVKSMKPDAANKIIFISGDSVSDGTQTFLKDTGNLFLKKPFTLEDLMKVISKHISANS